MIRILQIVTIMNRAGLESRLMDIYRNINREKIQFDFYTNRMEIGDFDNEILELGGIVFYSNGIQAFREKKKCIDFERFLQEHKEYRIVHSHVNEWSSIFCKAAMIAKVPVRIAHSRGANQTISLKGIYKNAVARSIKQYATHYFAVSKEAGEHLFGKKAVNDGLVRILPNAIDTNRFRFDPIVRKIVRDRLKITDETVIIHVGNLSPVKNHMYLLKVFDSVKKQDNRIKLLLVGEGNQRVKIEQWIADNNYEDSVSLLGKRSDVSELLQAADIFVFPSLHEGFPGAVLEAETSGLKCYISDTVTQEVVLTSYVSKMSIKDSPSIWAKRILDERNYERIDCSSIVRTAGYDISDLASVMEKLYINLYYNSNY